MRSGLNFLNFSKPDATIALAPLFKLLQAIKEVRMRSFLLVLLLLLAPALYLYSAENPPSPQRQTNLPANQSLGDDPPVTVEPPSLQHRAEQGDVEAQYRLAIRHDYGIGVPQDYVEARKWYLKAAEQGHASAQHNLGFLYSNGQGVPQDYVTAYALANIAVAQGNEMAKRNRDLAAAKLDAASLAEAQKLSKEYFKLYVEPFQ